MDAVRSVAFTQVTMLSDRCGLFWKRKLCREAEDDNLGNASDRKAR